MLKLRLFFILCLLTKPALARDNSLALELVGRTGFYSISYERIFSEELSAGAGLSYFPSVERSFEDAMRFELPVYMNGYFLAGKHRPYATAGTNFGEDGVWYGNAAIGGGYEYAAADGFLFRVAPYLVFADGIKTRAGLTLGTHF